MSGELMPLLVALLARAMKEGLKLTSVPSLTTDEREGILVECEQEGLAWLVGEDGTVYCDACGYVPDECRCDG